MLSLFKNCFSRSAYCSLSPWLVAQRLQNLCCRYILRLFCHMPITMERWPPNLVIIIPWMSNKRINMALNLERLIRAIFGFGDFYDFQCIDYHLVYGLYVITEFIKSGLSAMCFKQPSTIPCDALFIHVTGFLEPILYKPLWWCSINSLEFVESFACPN